LGPDEELLSSGLKRIRVAGSHALRKVGGGCVFMYNTFSGGPPG